MNNKKNTFFTSPPNHSLHRFSPFGASLWVAYLLLSAFVLYHHEMWRDELQAWLIAKNSNQLSDVFKNLEYDGHPALWHLMLFFITRFEASPLAMQILHWLIAASATYIFLKESPFSSLHKSLFIFGYYPMYEYSAISRNYVLAMVLVFLFCASYRHLSRRLLQSSAILFFLFQTHVYGLIIGLCLAPLLLYAKSSLKIKLAAVFIIFSGMICGLVQMVPPEDSGFAAGWVTEFNRLNIPKTLSIIWRSLAPVPSLQISFWNTNILDFAGYAPQSFLSLMLIFFISVIFFRRPVLLTVFLAGISGLLIFTHIKYYGFMRHFGNIYLLFIAVWWLSYYLKEKQIPQLPSRIIPLYEFLSKNKNAFFTAILSLQVLGGFFAVYYEYRHPFSLGKKAAEFLSAQGEKTNNRALVETSDLFTSITIAGFMNAPVYHPQCNRFSRFVVWDKCSGNELGFEEAYIKGKQLSTTEEKDVLFISMKEQDTLRYSIVSVAQFIDSAIVAEERYYLYGTRFSEE